ncbi:MAG: rRNA maturation RNase YbeY [Bacteroidetes bacterium]|nr:rRNA maturation RNase YbeY [Bacteroidota bacterium]
MKDVYYNGFDDSEYTTWFKKGVEASLYQVKANYSLNFIRLSENEMVERNNEILNHNYLTDIITIPYNESETFIEADILVNFEFTKAFSEQNGFNIKNEFIRLGCHGILHLIGFNDKSPKEQNIMRREEQKIIDMVSRGTSLSN